MWSRDAYPVIYNTILQIITDEVEHEEDLAALKKDLELMLVKRK